MSDDPKILGNDKLSAGEYLPIGSGSRIFVQGCRHRPKKYVFDKKDFCFFCQRSFLSTSLIRHMTGLHSDEEEVKKIQELEKNSVEKKRCLQLLRNLGNHKHNENVLKHGGSLVVVQRPRRTVEITKNIRKYAACENCWGYYSSEEIRRHTCPARSTNKIVRKLNVFPVTFNYKPELQSFFSRMRDDSLAHIAKNDELLLRMISKEVLDRGMKNYKSISVKVRLMSSFLELYRNEVKNAKLSFTDVLLPYNIDQIKAVILKMFHYNAQSSSDKISLNKPSSMNRLCQSLFQLISVLKVMQQKACDQEKICETQNLIDILEAEIRPLMANAGHVLASATKGLPKQLPSSEEISKLMTYIDNIIATTPLEKSNLKLLTETTLAYLIIFNKRRSGEACQVKNEMWENRIKWKRYALEEAHKLSQSERKMIEDTELVYTSGKCNRYVPLIFPKKVVPIVEWLSTQTKEYIFENSKQNPFRGNDALRFVCQKAGLNPDNLNSTQFRKHAATTLQVSLMKCLLIEA